jgi:tRNA pseudouridine13 synthase
MPISSWLDQTLPYLTRSVPALGGRIRATPEDFCVEERPLYLPCGQG